MQYLLGQAAKAFLIVLLLMGRLGQQHKLWGRRLWIPPPFWPVDLVQLTEHGLLHSCAQQDLCSGHSETSGQSSAEQSSRSWSKSEDLLTRIGSAKHIVLSTCAG